MQHLKYLGNILNTTSQSNYFFTKLFVIGILFWHETGKLLLYTPANLKIQQDKYLFPKVDQFTPKYIHAIGSQNSDLKLIENVCAKNSQI